MHIRPHPDHSLSRLLKRTISAQLHFIGCLIAIVGMLVLVRLGARKPEPYHFWAVMTFGLTSIFVFGASAAYHFICDGYAVSPTLRKRLKDLDHFAIYFFISGSYTIYVLNALTYPWNARIIAIVWTVALIGVLYTHFKPRLPAWAQHRAFSTLVFVAMGWIVVFKIDEIVRSISTTAFVYLLMGSAAYTVGAVVYALKRPRLYVNVFGYHELWHVLVIFGYGFHYLSILTFYQ